MAAITITAANVAKVTGALTTTGTAGATITQGQAVYLDATTNTYKLADANDTAATSAAVGISLNAASSGQPLTVLTSGDITIGGTVAVGEVYAVGTTAGAILPYSEIVSTNYVTLLGIGVSATVLRVQINATQIAKA